MDNYNLRISVISHKEQKPKVYILAVLLFSISWNDLEFPRTIRGSRWSKNPSTVCLQKRIDSSKFYNCPSQCCESLLYFLLIPWWRHWQAKPSSLGYVSDLEKQHVIHWFRLCLFYDSPIAQWEVNTFFCSSQLLLFVLGTWPTLRMFHRTLPCGVCFLWGFGAPVTVLDGGCWRHAGVECGIVGVDPGRWVWLMVIRGLCQSDDTAFSHVFLKTRLQSNQPARLWFR